MSDQTPIVPPARTPRAHAPLLLRLIARGVKDAAPYALAVGVFAITAQFTLNPTAARYADQLFALALILARTGGRTPPTQPPAPGAQP